MSERGGDKLLGTGAGGDGPGVRDDDEAVVVDEALRPLLHKRSVASVEAGSALRHGQGVDVDASPLKGHRDAVDPEVLRMDPTLLRAIAVERRLYSWYQSAWKFTLFLLALVGIGMAVFLYHHVETDPMRHMRKIFFICIYVPFYLLISILICITNSHFELNDFISKGAFFLIGSALTFVFLTVFSSVVTALSLV